MGYESKVYLVDEHHSVQRVDPQQNKRNWSEVIAYVNMCAMGTEFVRLFSTEFTGYFYADDGNTEVLEDKYGDKLTFSYLPPIIEFLENEIKEGNSYRRLPILLNLLKSINPENFEDIKLVHFGY